jgi:hypothetical protein
MRYRRAQKSPGLLQYLAHARAKALLGYVQRGRASVGRACARAPGPADPGYELASAVFSAHQQGSEPIFTILPPRLASSHITRRVSPGRRTASHIPSANSLCEEASPSPSHVHQADCSFTELWVLRAIPSFHTLHLLSPQRRAAIASSPLLLPEKPEPL